MHTGYRSSCYISSQYMQRYMIVSAGIIWPYYARCYEHCRTIPWRFLSREHTIWCMCLFFCRSSCRCYTRTTGSCMWLIESRSVCTSWTRTLTVLRRTTQNGRISTTNQYLYVGSHLGSTGSWSTGWLQLFIGSTQSVVSPSLATAVSDSSMGFLQWSMAPTIMAFSLSDISVIWRQTWTSPMCHRPGNLLDSLFRFCFIFIEECWLIRFGFRKGVLICMT